MPVVAGKMLERARGADLQAFDASFRFTDGAMKIVHQSVSPPPAALNTLNCRAGPTGKMNISDLPEGSSPSGTAAVTLALQPGSRQRSFTIC
jgi:hypothetical protein